MPPIALLLFGVIVRPEHVTRPMLGLVTAIALATQVPLAVTLIYWRRRDLTPRNPADHGFQGNSRDPRMRQPPVNGVADTADDGQLSGVPCVRVDTTSAAPRARNERRFGADVDDMVVLS